jgi:hypothetical protein
MSNAYPPCHCLLDSAGYLRLVELLIRRRCQIARRLPGQPDQPDELHKSLVSRPNSNQTCPERSSNETQTAGKARPFAFPLLPGRSVADAYPSPYAVTPTVNHRPPAHHAVAAISIGSVVGAAVCIVRSSIWWLAEILWKRHYNWARQKWERRPNLGRRRTIPPNWLIHESAYQRGGDYARHLPPDAIPTG